MMDGTEYLVLPGSGALGTDQVWEEGEGDAIAQSHKAASQVEAQVNPTHACLPTQQQITAKGCWST